MNNTGLILLAALTVISDVHAGWEFTAATKAEGGAENAPSDMLSSTAKTWVDGLNFRTEFIESKNPIMRQGSSMISTNGGATLILLDPETKTYTELDVAALAGGAMKMMGGMMKFTEPSVQKVEDRDDGSLLGHPVRYHKIISSHGMEMNIFGLKQKTEVETTQEFWVSKKTGDVGSGFMKSKAGLNTGDEAIDKILLGAMDDIKGLPLKQIMVSRSTDSDGSVDETRVVTEVTEIKEVETSPATFEIPAGYTEGSLLGGAKSAPRKQKSPDDESETVETPRGLMDMMKKMKLPMGP
jgi:hypothetical protein